MNLVRNKDYTFFANFTRYHSYIRELALIPAGAPNPPFPNDLSFIQFGDTSSPGPMSPGPTEFQSLGKVREVPLLVQRLNWVPQCIGDLICLLK